MCERKRAEREGCDDVRSHISSAKTLHSLSSPPSPCKKERRGEGEGEEEGEGEGDGEEGEGREKSFSLHFGEREKYDNKKKSNTRE